MRRSAEPTGRGVRSASMQFQSTTPGNGCGIVERNIQALLDRQSLEQQRRSLQQRWADAVTRAAGSMPFVYAHLALVAFWVVVNAHWTPLKPFDPSFVLLATFASVEAIFLTAFVLVTQNRMQREADRRADLDLQISLLTEYELTRVIQLVGKIAARLDVKTAEQDLEELQRDVTPEQVLDAMEQAAEQR